MGCPERLLKKAPTWAFNKVLVREVMLMNPASERLRQESCRKFEVSLACIANSKLTWAT